MAHDDYYTNLNKSADNRLMRASHAMHEPTTCAERFDQLAHVVGPRFAAVIDAYFDAKMAHHELHENKP